MAKKYVLSLMVTVEIEETPDGPFYKGETEFQGAVFEAFARNPANAAALTLDELSRGLKDGVKIMELLEAK